MTTVDFVLAIIASFGAAGVYWVAGRSALPGWLCLALAFLAYTVLMALGPGLLS